MKKESQRAVLFFLYAQTVENNSVAKGLPGQTSGEDGPVVGS